MTLRWSAKGQLSLPPSLCLLWLSGQDQRCREGGALGHGRSRPSSLLCQCKLELQALQPGQAESRTTSVSMGWDVLDPEGFQQ